MRHYQGIKLLQRLGESIQLKEHVVSIISSSNTLFIILMVLNEGPVFGCTSVRRHVYGIVALQLGARFVLFTVHRIPVIHGSKRDHTVVQGVETLSIRVIRP